LSIFVILGCSSSRRFLGTVLGRQGRQGNGAAEGRSKETAGGKGSEAVTGEDSEVARGEGSEAARGEGSSTNESRGGGRLAVRSRDEGGGGRMRGEHVDVAVRVEGWDMAELAE
jgi:hypothetical protein